VDACYTALNVRGKGLNSAEAEAEGALSERLAGHLSFTREIQRLAGVAITASDAMPEQSLSRAQIVNDILLTRASNDLRCAAILAKRGYPLQAMSLVSTIYELAYMVAYIGANSECAGKWMKHADPTTSFVAPKPLTRAVLDRCRIREQVESEYGVYTQLCQAKHANPILETRDLYEPSDEDDDTFVMVNGPRLSAESTMKARFALEQGGRLLAMAVEAYAKNHLSGSEQTTVLEGLVVARVRCVELQEESTALYRRILSQEVP
jgi:hypothetical protein